MNSDAQPTAAPRRSLTATGALQPHITAYWDARAEAYDANQRHQIEPGAVREAWRRVWQAALPPPPCDVLDVGTGTGQVALLAAELGHRVWGIDLSEGMLARARAKGARLPRPPRFSRGDAAAHEVPSGSCDAITARYVLWTLPAPAAALAHWRRVLRPGGRLAIVDSTWFPGGLEAGGSLPAAFRAHYGSGVLERLPLATAASISATVEAVHTAGYRQVAVHALEEIAALERARQDELSHTVRLQYLITATRA